MRFLLFVVAMVMARGLGTSAITLRSTDANANAQKATRFAGLAYNLLKADPDAAGGGGVDPGFLTARRVVELDTGNYESFPRYSCVSQSFVSFIYDEKSFQRKFDMDVKTEFGVSSAVAEAKFSLSTSFMNAKDQTTKSKVMTMESQTLCNLGKARLKSELHTYKISQSFQAAVCQLPDNYDQTAYVRFIDDWGTNYVAEVDVGVRNLTKKSESFTSVFEDLQTAFSTSVGVSGSYGGAILSVSGSIEMNMNVLSNSQQLKEAFNSKEIIKTIGSEAAPEPISVVLGSLDKLVTATAFGTTNPAACTSTALSKLPTKQANLARALKEYPAAKGAVVSPSDGKARFILNWPKGTYGLLQPKSGCPAGWASGTRGYDCEDFNNESGATAGNHFASEFKIGNIHQKYCIKTVPTTDVSTDINWPKGEYCIYKYRDCPVGFEQGKIVHDDEDTRNVNWVQGILPDGQYDYNTHIYVCCRSDGANTVPIYLPTTKPFYLFQATAYGCQHVAGMRFQSEKIIWDDEDGGGVNENSKSGVVPYYGETGNPKNWHLYYCYYYV